MPIEQTRIEAAARALAERDGHDPDGLVSLMPDTLGPAWKWYEGTAVFAAAALFPELASDPPAGWVAPMEASAAMIEAYTLSEVSFCPAHDSYENSGKHGFAAMRDAHLKEQYERITLGMHEAAAKAVRARPRRAHLKEQGHE